MATLKPAGRSRLREWWPELVAGAFFGTYMVALHTWGGTALVLVFAVIFWLMGHRHRRLPMQATLDGVRQDVTAVREDMGEIRDTVHAAVEALTESAPQRRPDLRLVD